MPRHALSVFFFCFLALFVAGSVHAQMGPAQVLVAPVESRQVARTQPLVATIEPITRSTVAAEEAGLVSARQFDEGERIEQGQLLARVKTDVLESQKAAMAAAQDSAEAMLARASADADNAQRELKRIEELHRRQVTSEKEYQDALTMARAMDAMIGVRKAELAEKAADVARLDLLIKKSETRAPMAGIVGRRHVEVGQWIKQGDPIADIVPLDPLFVRVNVPENVISTVQKGDPAVVIVDALGGKEFTGKVEQILPEADANSRTFPVKIVVANPKFELRPGFFARVVLTSRSEEARFVVPRDAIVTRGDDSRVAVVREGKAVVIPVVLGASVQGGIAVSGALQPNDQVIIRGNEGLRGGEAVVVLNAPRGGGSGESAPAAQGKNPAAAR